MPSGFVVWMTGLPGSGKTTIAKILEQRLRSRGKEVELLDEDLRRSISPELGFSKEDRELHARRVAYISRLLSNHEVGVIVALISPYRSFRQVARKSIQNFIEVYVKCPLDVCIERDKKGLYEKALKGEIQDLTGIQDPYEEPLKPEVVVHTQTVHPEQAADKIMNYLESNGFLTGF